MTLPALLDPTATARMLQARATFARDANDAAWYVLRYAADFERRNAAPGVDEWRLPRLEPSVFYDDARHVLELMPVPLAAPVEPLAGLAVDLDGEIYRVDERGVLLVRRCDGSECPLVIEPGVFMRPSGLALDRRGLLYVADALAGRVVVVDPEDGHVANVLVAGLQEPVDVAVAPVGWIYVADRKAGEISVWNVRHERCASFVPRTPDGLPAHPAPIAVMVDGDAILVADASHPRLIRVDRGGAPSGDVPLAALVQGLGEGALALDALRRIYGAEVARFWGGSCAAPCTAHDGGVRLAAVHRAIRLARLRLASGFATAGRWVSAALDGGAAGAQWHRITIDADLPEGSWLKVRTVVADDPALLADPDVLPPGIVFEARDETPGTLPPRYPSDVPDRLVLSGPGRYLRLAITLGSDGRATPSVRAVRVSYPRVSYLDLLPRVFRRDPDAARFLERYLALFEHTLTGVEDRYERFYRQLDPRAAPPEILEWIGRLLDLTFDPSWPLARRRALAAEAVALYAMRGTPAGVARAVELYAGRAPVIIEGFRERAATVPPLGREGAVLGCGTLLGAPPVSRGTVREDGAHRFTVLVFLDDECDAKDTLPTLRRVLALNQPAHTIATLRVVTPDTRVGDGLLGIDAVVGARPPAALPIGGCDATPREQPRRSALGIDSILGERRATYARPLAPTL